MVIFVGMGERMAERFLPIYVMALGGTGAIVGILSGLQNLLGALYSFPGGHLSERLGTKRALLVFNAMAMIGFLIVILIPTWPAVIAGSFFFLSWSAISLPASMSLVAKVLPKNQRTMGVSMHSLVRRIPMALGPLLGGWFVDTWGKITGVRLAFVAAFFMVVVAIFLQQRLIEDDAPKAQDPNGTRPQRNPLAVAKRMSAKLQNLLVSDILIRFCEQIPYAFVVIWCMETISSPVSGEEFGVLTVIEMVTAVLCYIPVAYFADRVGKKPFVVVTFVFFTLFPLFLLFCHSFWVLVPAFILRGLKEFGEPTRKALIMDLAPDDAKAAMFGVYYLIRDSIVSVAAFGGGLIWQYISPTANLVTAFAFGVIGTLWFAWRGADMPLPEAGGERL
jgi:MFS family permease